MLDILPIELTNHTESQMVLVKDRFYIRLAKHLNLPLPDTLYAADNQIKLVHTLAE